MGLKIFLFDQRHKLCYFSEKLRKKRVIDEFKEPALNFGLCNRNQLCKILDLLVVSHGDLLFLFLDVFAGLFDLVVAFDGFNLGVDGCEPLF